jgi:hypothetical protein
VGVREGGKAPLPQITSIYSLYLFKRSSPQNFNVKEAQKLTVLISLAVFLNAFIFDSTNKKKGGTSVSRISKT